jgi:hypothetical protein
VVTDGRRPVLAVEAQWAAVRVDRGLGYFRARFAISSECGTPAKRHRSGQHAVAIDCSQPSRQHELGRAQRFPDVGRSGPIEKAKRLSAEIT